MTTQQREDSSTPVSPVDDRRSVVRAAPNVHSIEFRIVLSGMVIDESPLGVALSIPSPYDLRIGQQIEINYAGFPLRAEVRNLELTMDGRYRLGLQWVDPYVMKWVNTASLSELTGENSWLLGEPGDKADPLAAPDWDACDI